MVHFGFQAATHCPSYDCQDYGMAVARVDVIVKTYMLGTSVAVGSALFCISKHCVLQAPEGVFL